MNRVFQWLVWQYVKRTSKYQERRRLWMELLTLRDLDTEGGLLMRKVMLLRYFNMPMECLSENELAIAGEANRLITRVASQFGVSTEDIKFNA